MPTYGEECGADWNRLKNSKTRLGQARGHLDEILILCHSSAIADSSAWDRSNLALLVARPREGNYELFPQDWFNNAGLDYGYQWVTRVARDLRTGRVHGEGIRIDPFMLDSTLRNTR